MKKGREKEKEREKREREREMCDYIQTVSCLLYILYNLY